MTGSRVVHVNDQIPDAVYIGRSVPRKRIKASIWANPYRVGDQYPGLPGNNKPMDVAQVLWLYLDHLYHDPDLLRKLPDLRGRVLACWCRHDGDEPTPSNACHGDMLVHMVDRFDDVQLRRLAGGETVTDVVRSEGQS